jgi:hypothetical protein
VKSSGCKGSTFLFILFTLCFQLLTLNAIAQHPSSFPYNIEKKKYTVSGSEQKAVKKSIEDWFTKHDTVGTLEKTGQVIFSPDYKTLPECDSIGQRISYNKDKFQGFPADNHGSFFGADIILKNKQGQEEHYTVDVSYWFEVVRIWFQEKTLFKAKE